MAILGLFGHFWDFLKIFEKIDFSTKIDFLTGWGHGVTYTPKWLSYPKIAVKIDLEGQNWLLKWSEGPTGTLWTIYPKWPPVRGETGVFTVIWPPKSTQRPHFLHSPAPICGKTAFLWLKNSKTFIFSPNAQKSRFFGLFDIWPRPYVA